MSDVPAAGGEPATAPADDDASAPVAAAEAVRIAAPVRRLPAALLYLNVFIVAACRWQFIQPLLPRLLHALHFQHLGAIAMRVDSHFLEPFFNRLQITQRITESLISVSGDKPAVHQPGHLCFYI